MATSIARPRRRLLSLVSLAAAAFLAAGAAPSAPVDSTGAALDPVVTEVRVERLRPRKERVPTLRFLKENRDFIRARFDLLREKPLDRSASAEDIDPRFMAYRRTLAEILAARDSVAVAEEARNRRELFESVTDLGRLEAQLDEMEKLLADQRGRLGVLQEDFTGRQQTALMIVLAGQPRDASITQIGIALEGGGVLSVPVSAGQIESLRRGGILQLSHGLIEPRQQVLEIVLTGDRWPQGDSCFVTLDPPRDRLSVLKLDLSRLAVGSGAGSVTASTWIHDASLRASHETEP